MRPILPLSAYRRPVDGPLHLLSRSENGLTFAFGYALACVPRLLGLFLASLDLGSSTAHHLRISLQAPDKDGITDIELWLPDGHLLAIVEAKKHSWPGHAQLSRYARRLQQHGAPRSALVPLGVPPQVQPLTSIRQLLGVRVVSRRWADMLQLVSDALASRNAEHSGILTELKDLIQEVIKMRSYDREVLIRDLKTTLGSYELFLDDNIYRCPVGERAEPLFFAPCFTGARNRRENGIHYVSRVYCRSVVKLRSADSIKAALVEAGDAVRRVAKPLRRRKTVTVHEQVVNLDGLPDKWRRGLASTRARTKGDENVVFFLGDPIRLPAPLAKRGFMVPPGFSMTMEQLMSPTGSFHC